MTEAQAFEQLCREHDIFGTAAARQCEVFWRAGADYPRLSTGATMQLHIAHATINLTLPHLAEGLLSELVPGEPIRVEPEAAGRTMPPAHGEYWHGQGGYYICTQPALLGLPARHLIFGKGEAEDLTFGPGIDVAGATSQLGGRGNTAALLASGQEHPAAKWAAAYTADGHSDFHLPSRMDLLMAYVCAPQLFQKSGWYWSSTQGSRSNAFVQDFEGGGSGWYVKGNEHRVRACRWIP